MKIKKLTEEYNKGEWVEVNLNTKKNGTPNIIPVKVDKELYHGKSFLGWAWGERQHEYPMSAIVNRIDGDDTTEIIKRYSLKEDINVDTVGDYIVDHYDFDNIDDKYSCINSIRDSFKGQKTISKEELEQFIGSYNGRDKVNESKSIKESTDYKVKFFQVFEAPKSPKENGKMIGQRGTLDDANAFGRERVGEGNYIIKAVCDDGKTRNIDNDTKYDAYRMSNSMDEGYFSDDDVEDDIEHANLYGGDTMYCRDCGTKKKWDDGYSFCPKCNGELEESGISDVEPKFNFQGKSSHTFTKDKKWEVDFDEKGNILARTRHGKPSYFKGHINDKVNDFPHTDEDNIVLAAKEQHGLKFGGLKEASYGGAFDIADDQYFTRDDIENAAEEVLNHINETFTEQYELGGTWFEDGKWIVNVKSIDGEWEFEELLPIDMRKIKEPWHLKREYAFEMASKFIDKIKLETQPITESLNEDTDTVAVEGPKEGPEAGLSSLINEAIQDELKTIDIYNSLSITARSEGYEDIAKMIDEINTEENKHVGQLQEALKSISPNAIAIEDGTAEGQEQLSNAVMFDDDLNDDELGIALFKLR